MKRRLFNVLAAMSLVLCVADITLVVGSIFFRVAFSFGHRDSFTVAAPSWGFGSSAVHGVLELSRVSYVSLPPLPPDYESRKSASDHQARWHGEHYELGFGFMSRPWGWPWHDLWLPFEGNGYSNTGGKGMTLSTIHIPFWPSIPILMILPIAWVHKRRQHYRAINRKCIHCGYDLRATPDRCPECGVVPEKVNR